MNTFRTIVNVKEQENKMSYDAHLLFMGSCFAGNIGKYFEETGFNALVNPFGVLYNPFSIAKSIDRLIDANNYQKTDLIFHNQVWQSFDHHSSFNRLSQQECLSNINQSLKRGSDFITNANYLFITFGTAWIYQLKDTKKVVSNCHKFPSSLFTRQLITQQQIIERYTSLFDKLYRLNPSLKIILTVSPVRHWKDGAHGNQISKAHLLLAIDELCNQFKNTTYFPAYEILLDDLRDYRFFDSDMLHPSNEAIQYIRSKFIETFLNSSAIEFANQMKKITDALHHRPFNEQSEQYHKFLQKNIHKIDQIEQKFNNVSLSSFKSAFISLLSKHIK
nr:GSCFA domain-containing protein [uncultured Carboxylicivirga sp.]